MKKAIEAFRKSIERVKHLGGLHDAIISLTSKVTDPSDILRAQVVLSVSALDYYVHEITVLGMVEVLNCQRPATASFRKYKVSVDSLLNGSTKTGSNWFEAEVRKNHSYLSFQQPEKIADAIRLFSDVKLWQEVGQKMTMSEADVKARLKLIVDRRNKIAHEADMDPSYPGARWPITKKDVDGLVYFVSRICECIHSIVT